MDTSELFIKMADCPEIQEMRETYHEGDYVAYPMEPDNYDFYIAVERCSGLDCGGCDDQSKDDFNRDKLEVWLPQQDDLQAMVRGNFDEKGPIPHISSILSMISAFNLFCHPIGHYRVGAGEWIGDEFNGGFSHTQVLLNEDILKYPKQFKSLEQLWLAFVMRMEYNKDWDGSEWVPCWALCGVCNKPPEQMP